MEAHGYAKNFAKEFGYCITYYELLKNPLNEKNPTAVLTLHKGNKTIKENALCDPISKGEFIKGKFSYFSKDSLLEYGLCNTSN